MQRVVYVGIYRVRIIVMFVDGHARVFNACWMWGWKI